MNVLIRPATVADALLIADLSRQTFYETFADQNKPADMEKFMNEQFTRGRLILEVGQTGLHFFLAFIDNQAAGYVKLKESSPPASVSEKNALELARLYAAKAFLGNGVGKALMQKSLEVAAQLSRKNIWLGVWEHNKRAIDFYQKWGFKKCGAQDFLLGDDVQTDWLMEKRIP